MSLVHINVPWREWLILLAVFLMAFIPRMLFLGSFWGTDERYHWELSNEFLLALLRHDWANTVPQGLPGLTLAWIEAIGVGVRWLLAGGQLPLDDFIQPDRPFAYLARRQEVVVVVHTLIVVGIYHLTQQLAGRRSALLGVLFIALDPFLLAESRVLRFEALVAGLMPLSLLAALLHLKKRLFLGERGHKYLMVSATLAALAMLTKISAIFLLPVTAFLGAATLFAHAPVWSALPGWLFNYLAWVGLTLFCFWLFWPAMWVAPLATLQEVRQFVEAAGYEGFDGRGIFFWGQVYPDDPGYWFYPVALLFRLTPLVLLGILLALIFLPAGFRLPLHDERDWQKWLVVCLLVYALLFALMMALGAKKYDRYLMPIFPALALVAGQGWGWLRFLAPLTPQGRGAPSPPAPLPKKGEGCAFPPLSLWERGLGGEGISFPLGLTALLLIQGFTTLPHLPYYYTYYNPLLGGAGQAVHYVPVGYGEGLDQVAAYLEQKPHAADLKLASGNSGKLVGLFSGQRIALANLDGKWVQGDYVLIYISQLQGGKHAEDILAYLARQKPEYTLTLHGLEYAWLYPGPAAQYYGGGHKLEGRGTFFGYSLSAPELAAGDTLHLTLYWRNEGQLPDDRFFVRLKDLDGYTWADALTQPRPGFEAAATARQSIMESEANVPLPVGIPPGDYFLEFGFRTVAGDPIGLFELPEDAKPLPVAPAQNYPAPDALPVPHSSHLLSNDDLLLFGYDLSPPGTDLGVTLYWQAGAAGVRHDYVILLRLLDGEEHEVAYWLGRPVRSGYPTPAWQAGQIVQDPWRLALPPGVQPGPYQLEVATFDAATEQEVSRAPLGELIIK
jgi:hypothetical protein